MSTPDTLARIATVFSELGAGVPDDTLRRTLFTQLAEDFNQLALDLATDTGWVAMVGTATKGGGFNTATVTLPQLAQVVKAATDALTSRGVLGP